ncbi:anhydro-N-acetylmuramic acid kinase [mine drainage metagenome]|uniref:Anhydro-N-acetylmuramic acid kinase n=1 Tax=mine drainage metagenome TaxID=410659 RepID=A0A1J5P9S7_9ZZZZ
MDVLLLGAAKGRVGALNLGGISNITIAGGGLDPIAYDIGAANALLDAVIQKFSAGRLSYDDDSKLARSGRVNGEWLKHFLAEPYYAQVPPKSTGKELFNLAYVENVAGPVTAEITPDLLATLTELTAVTVMDQVRATGLEVLYVAGGGTANPLMMERMRALSGDTRVELMSTLGIDPREKEPALFALIGLLTVHGLPANVPACTGATGPRILGSITPGRGPLVLPPVHAESITQLVIA